MFRKIKIAYLTSRVYIAIFENHIKKAIRDSWTESVEYHQACKEDTRDRR